MTDRRALREELLDTVPDPTVDFNGFIAALADQVVASYFGEQLLPHRERGRRRLARAAGRVARMLQPQQLSITPAPLVDLNLRALARALCSYSEARECPDNET